MEGHFKKTKIVATVGPACNTKDKLIELAQAGVNIFRLNFSHGTHEEHAQVIKFIREINKEYQFNTGILVDLQGPKIRVGDVKDGSVVLKTGKKVIITTKKTVSTADKISTTYKALPKDVELGARILLDDGKLELKVTKLISAEEVETEVVYGGDLKPKKGINLPFTKISQPSLTEKDTKDLHFALGYTPEWIALSFVRSPIDILLLKHIIRQQGKEKECKVIAKIEKPEAIEEIDAIIKHSDGLMVARGDLGVEINNEEVPMAQKMIVKKSRQAAKPVIIATQMMESMISSPRPTRAETNDIANAVMDGADALMLSGETSVGKYPIITVQTMTKTIKLVEDKTDRIYNKELDLDKNSETFYNDSVIVAACILAKDTNADALIGMTNSGYTAYKIARHRPLADIFIFTSNKSLLNTLNLIWGVRAFYYDSFVSTDHTFYDIQNFLVEQGLLKKGNLCINLASMPIERKSRTNMLKLSWIR